MVHCYLETLINFPEVAGIREDRTALNRPEHHFGVFIWGSRKMNGKIFLGTFFARHDKWNYLIDQIQLGKSKSELR